MFLILQINEILSIILNICNINSNNIFINTIILHYIHLLILLLYINLFFFHTRILNTRFILVYNTMMPTIILLIFNIKTIPGSRGSGFIIQVFDFHKGT